ncbi:MAG: TonB-dependent receptor, partial [Pyrinomonadaceae bacterium]|nr:TonB-dependent receptor [Pyrinomonadaceae bacterium]
MSAAAFLYAQDASTVNLSGTVKSAVNDELIPGVSVEIPRLKKSTETDENGRFEFRGLPNGTYTVITHIEGFADKAQSVKISGGAATLDFELDLKSLSAEVTITASGEGESVYEVFSSVNSIGTTSITEKASTSIGEILESQPGVSKRSFGSAGTGRPTIRGFEGDRVLVLQDGVRTGSLGAQSGDHGEPVAPFNLERLEVIKGPATLLYGSNAIGGVVNAVTEDENDAHPGFRGYLTGTGGTVNRQAGIAGGIEYGVKKTLFNLNLNSSRDGDYQTPLGRIPNSGSRAKGGSGGLGYFSEKGFIRGGINLDRRRYGIPYAPLFESGELLSIANGGADCDVVDCQFDFSVLQNTFENQLPSIPDEQIDIKMRKNNYRFIAGFRDLKRGVTEGTFTVDFTDYRHQEIETEDLTDTIATTFDNDVFSYRGTFRQAKYKKLSGQFGFEGYRRSYETVGAESLIDGRVRQNNFSVFGLQEVSFDRVALQFGARVETNRFRPTNNALLERSFTGFSGAVGARFTVWKGGSLITSFSSSYRPPSLEELYNMGPHIGTVTFEIGDQDLQRERSNGFELSFRQNSERIRFNGSIFYNDINNFIYAAPQDFDGNGIVDIDDGLPIAAFIQSDARFYGADARLDVDINDHFGIFVSGDVVNAKLKNSETPLVRITPARLRIGTDIRLNSLSIRPEAVFVGEKGAGDIFPLETTTEGYG